jgi:hypothetical protein
MSKDPKFGWHVIWVIPAIWCFLAYQFMYDYFARRKEAKFIANLPPELKRLRTLSGRK